jgi:hypothetical protein
MENEAQAWQSVEAMREERDRALEALRRLIGTLDAKFGMSILHKDGCGFVCPECERETCDPATCKVGAILKTTDEASAVLSKHPAPKLSPAPEIRYQLRNWHHVTCTIPFAGPCTCLEARENLIKELTPRKRKGDLNERANG